MTLTSKILKQRARTLLGGKYFAGACITLSASAASLLLNYLLTLSGFSPYGDLTQVLCYWAMSIVILLLSAVLSMGLTRFFLNLSLGTPCGPGDLYYCFTHDADRFILAGIFRYGLLYAAWIPVLLFYLNLPEEAPFTGGAILTLLALLAAALVLDAVILLYLGQMVYVLLEDPECSVLEALIRSCQLMAGHRLAYLKVLISFLGCFLLELGTFGLGRLWIRPYLEMTLVQFYLELTERPFSLPEQQTGQAKHVQV